MKCSFGTPFVSVLIVALLCTIQITAISQDAVSIAILRQKSYYFGNTFKLNWHKASSFCRSLGLFLVSIRNQAQLDEVIENVKNSEFFRVEKTLQLWTSGNDLGEEHQFIWTSTGDRIVFDRWSVGEPNHVKLNDCTIEHCVVLQHYEPPLPGGANYSLDDRFCQNEYFFMCESLDG
uniref:C-type lectin domain-containing protein n=1 Tax=Anopheles culicifacies TaxID=139723 RepID=A0A182MQ36_9DIPT